MPNSPRRVLITGAGSGLGLALAQRYAGRGDRVACIDLLSDRAEAARASLPGSGHLAHTADVADDASMQALAARVAQEWGGLDVLINNAGIASANAMVDTTMEEWRKVFEIDLFGVVRGCRLFLPGMLAAGSGQIINTASFAALAGAPGIMSYGAAKAAVYALSDQLRAEVHDRGVRVSVVCPAFFRTNLMDTAIADEKTRARVVRWMEKSPDSLGSVADKVFAAAERGEFLILPTRREPGYWRLKRWFPQLYFRQLVRRSATR
ncbi:MAG: SDR family NAD(P)-dependent oxidoreductase [Lysobacteraceae bacterium]|nr:MAG: SDR family NAD(P)-dependent oxidoreductase [Xanthomonadaceae bacterium]